MDKFLLNTFKDTLAQYIIGFQPDQVNAKLLVGKGEIVNVHLNVDIINDLLISTLTPIVRLKSAHITKLGFNVTSFTNLKKAPIVVTIDEINIVLEEPLEFKPYKNSSTPSSSKNSSKRGGYGIIEKIADNITVVINRVNLNFKTLGKFKTKKRGDWTPPQISCKLSNLRFELTDEFGVTGSPDVIWRNNRVKRTHNNTKIQMIYKKCFMDLSIGLNTSTDPNGMTHPIIKKCHVEMHMVLKRRIKDAGLLAIQSDLSITEVDVEIDSEDIPIIAHAAAGIQYCLAKDRHFEDPLKSDDSSLSTEQLSVHVEVTQNSETDEMKLNSDHSVGSLDEDEDFDDDFEYIDENSTEVDLDDDNQSIGGAKSLRQLRPTILLQQSNEGPLLELYGGITIFDNVTVTLSINKCKVRASYGKGAKERYFQINLRGLVNELILQKEGKFKKGYIQFSLACITIQNKHDGTTYPLLMGGFQEIQSMNYSNPYEERPTFKETVASDESFPWFINRSVRDDPLELRYSYPVQAIGFKTSINMDNESSDPFLTHELGLNNIEIALHSDPVYNAVCLLWNKDSRYDPRWHSGNWNDLLSSEVKLNGDLINWNEHLQPASPPTDMIAFFAHATVQGHNMYLKVPAAVQEDMTNSDIIISLDELMIIVSSALPRDFLDGRITGYTNKFTNIQKTDENKEMEGYSDKIAFPNELHDFCYDERLGECAGERPSDQIGPRIQVSFSSFVVEIKPILPILVASQPKRLLALAQTIILCSMDSFDKVKGDVFFLSAMIRRTSLNIDAELLSTALGSISYHFGVLNKTFSVLLASMSSDTEDPLESEVTKKRLEMHLIFCLHLRSIEVQLWKQNLPLKMQTEPNPHTPKIKKTFLLSKFTCEGFEIGFEFRTNHFNSLISSISSLKKAQINDVKTYFLLKCCIASMLVEICDVHKVKNVSDMESGRAFDEMNLMKILTLGQYEIEEDDSSTIPIPGFVLRVETWNSEPLDFAISAKVDKIMILMHIDAIKMLFDLLMESLVLPHVSSAFKKYSKIVCAESIGGGIFPFGSVGARFEAFAKSLAPKNKEERRMNPKTSPTLDQLSIGYILTKLTVNDIALLIPEIKETDDNLIVNEVSYFSFVIEQAELCGSLFPLSNNQIVSNRGINAWSDSLSDTSQGVHIKLSSRQRFDFKSKVIGATAGKEIIKSIVPLFGVKVGLHPSDAKISFDDPNILCTNLSLVEKFVKVMLMYREKVNLMVRNLEMSLNFGSISPKVNAGDTIVKRKDNEIKSEGARSILQEIIALIAKNDIFAQNTINATQKELEKTRDSLFIKERQRIALLSILSHNYSGYLRIGDRTTSGLRVLSTVTLSKFWVVQRHALLIIFKEAGMLTPEEIIPLEGTELRLVSVGRKNIDEKRGFLLTEANGRERTFVVTSERELGLWVSSLSKAIGQSKKKPKIPVDKQRRPSLGDDGMHKLESVEEANDRTIERMQSLSIEEKNRTEMSTINEKNESSESPAAKTNNVDNPAFQESATQDDIREINGASKEIRDKIPSTLESEGNSSFEKDSSLEHLSGGVTEGVRESQNEIEDEQYHDIDLKATEKKSKEDDEQSEPQSRRSRMRDKMSAMKANTTISKLSSAVKTARQESDTLKRFSNVKFQGTKMFSGSKSSNDKNQETDSSSSMTALPVTTEASELDSDFATIDLDSSLSVTDDSNSNSNISRREQLRRKIGKVPSINMNSRLSKFGSTVKSVTPNVDAIRHLNSDAFQNVRQSSDSNQAEKEVVIKSEISTEQEQETYQNKNPGNSNLEGISEDKNKDTLSDEKKHSVAIESEEKQLNSGKTNDSIAIENKTSRREELRKKMGKVPSIKINDRLSKFSSAVKSVRPNVDALKRQGSSGLLNTSRHGSKSNSSDKVKTKDMNITDIIPTSTHTGLDDKPEILEPIPETWIVKVDVVDRNILELKPEDDSTNMNPEENFSYQICSACLSPVKFRAKTKVIKSFDEISLLHATVSEDVTRVVLNETKVQNKSSNSVTKTEPEMETLSSELGLKPLDQIRFTGRLLQGLLNISPLLKNNLQINEYRGQIIAEFLNSCIETPMPKKARDAVVEFLNLHAMIEALSLDDSTNINDDSQNNNNISTDEKSTKIEVDSKSERIYALASTLECELMRAENNFDREYIKKDETETNLTEDKASISEKIILPDQGEQLPIPSIHNAHSAIYETVMSAMIERDEMYADIIASNVLHHHELDQERKRMSRLQLRCKSFEKYVDGGVLASAAFLSDVKEQQRKISNAMIQDTDMELLELCKQLSNEISGRTAASMEVIRLKEGRVAELALEKVEKENKEKEIQKLKENFENEKNKKEEFYSEMIKWKKMYEDLSGKQSNE